MGSQPKPMYMYEVDDTGRRLTGTKKSAKQRSSKERSEKLEVSEDKRKSKSDTGPQYDQVISDAKLTAMLENAKLERRKSSASTKSPSKRQGSRPPSTHANKSFPVLAIQTDQPSQYATPAPPVLAQYNYPPVQMRPRAVTNQTYPNSRPQSFHAAYTSAGYGTGPPISASAYYQPSILAPSYPPPSPSSSYMRFAAPGNDYFAPTPVHARPLSSRFESPIQRTSSALAMREHELQHAQDFYEDTGYVSASEAPIARRRNSIRIPSGKTRMRSQNDIDLEAMPPPTRPGILRNRSTDYYQDSYQDSYQDAAPDPPRNSRLMHRDDPPSRRSSTHRHSVSYDLPSQVRIETANTSHRRKSYYGQSESTNSGSGTAYEDKMREAAGYQDDVGGGPTTPLSAESLRRLHRRQAAVAAGSSRSTKSSGSREDESDYRKSATTHTSQSARHADDDFTIKVKGAPARIMVGNAQIDCADGGEVEIKRNKSIRNGSERSTSNYGDDRRSRIERPPGRSRMSSHSGRSYDRTIPLQYAPGSNYI